MEPHYNAFISYKHHPDDIRVAGEIHRYLERFKVPRAIGKKANQITRLFRDKEELPITSNLTDDIASALRNSDYLIVICSVHTRESIWVQREIELFLKTHSRNKVLTVLASGEPYDVIPEILLQEEVLDPTTGESTTVPVEPLSCDWRLPRKKAKQEELPRLAAALLGCGYDELRQRQRQHRIRKMITAFSVCLAASLCLAAYFLYTSITIRNANIQIQENLNESLRNQSHHLATAAQEQLSDGDRLTAIALAVAALPSEDRERPYVPEAEYVLAQALGVYNSSATLSAVGSVSPGSNILVNDFWVSDDGKYLYLRDQRNCITIWDTVTLEKLASLDFGTHFPGTPLDIGDGNIALLDGFSTTLSAYQPDGTCLWELSGCYDVAMLSDKSALLIITHDSYGKNGQLLFIDPSTGRQSGDPIVLDQREDSYLSPDFLQPRYAPDMPIVLQYYDQDAYSFRLLDLQTGADIRTTPAISFPIASVITDSGKLLVMSFDESMPLSGIIEGNRVNCPINDTIYCYDTADGRLLWTSQITSYTDTGKTSLTAIPGRNQVLCQTGSVFQIQDLDTGDTVARCETGSSILSVEARENFAIAVLQDGYVCAYHYDDNYCFEMKCLEQDLSQAAICGAYFGHQRLGTQVSIYRTMEPESAWSYEFQDSLYISDLKIHQNLMAFSNLDSAVLFDTAKKEPVLQMDKRLSQILGFSEDASTLYYQDEYGMLSFTHIATGKTNAWKIPQGEETDFYLLNSDLCLNRDRLLYTLRGLESVQLVCWDLHTGQAQYFPCCQESYEEDPYFDSQVIAATGQYAWIWTETGHLYEVNLEDGSARLVAEGIAQQPAVAFNLDESRLAITNLAQVLILTPGQEPADTIALTDTTAGSLCFYGEELLILCDNGYLYRYSLSGTLLSQIALTVNNSFTFSSGTGNIGLSKINWSFTEDGKLILSVFSAGNIIDCDSWKCIGYIPNFVIYEPAEDSFICQVGDQLLAYPRYTLQELLELAEEQLQNYQLTTEEKLAYGID